MLNKDKIESLVAELLKELDPSPEREGLRETPKRAAKYWMELMEGAQYTNDQIANMFNKCFEDLSTGDLVVEANIPIFSHCEHHLALMYDMKVHIGYIPKQRVIGLSKMSRIAEMVGKRLQLQERIGMDIASILKTILGTDDVVVAIQGKHGCMTARGIKSREACTITAALNGAFKEDLGLRQEFYNLVGIGKI